MKTAAAIITNRGGRTCHAAIVARELGIPAVVGAEGASGLLQDGEQVTVSCAEGDIGRVYAGKLRFRVDTSDLSTLVRPATEIMVNLGNPELAFKTSMLPCDGVGLARMEFIISEHIALNPKLHDFPPVINKGVSVSGEWATPPAGATIHTVTAECCSLTLLTR